jgi:hypothetical protein
MESSMAPIPQSALRASKDGGLLLSRIVSYFLSETSAFSSEVDTGSQQENALVDDESEFGRKTECHFC